MSRMKIKNIRQSHSLQHPMLYNEKNAKRGQFYMGFILVFIVACGPTIVPLLFWGILSLILICMTPRSDSSSSSSKGSSYRANDSGYRHRYNSSDYTSRRESYYSAGPNFDSDSSWEDEQGRLDDAYEDAIGGDSEAIQDMLDEYGDEWERW